MRIVRGKRLAGVNQEKRYGIEPVARIVCHANQQLFPRDALHPIHHVRTQFMKFLPQQFA